MIGKLKGKLVEVDGNVGLIETTGGVFYRLYLPISFTRRSFSEDEPVEFYTYLQVKEDDLVLFGFNTKDEYVFFKLLLSVSGVGPKTAYLVISYAKIPELIAAVSSNNIDYFSSIKGLGRKTAMKIILELSQKLKQQFSMDKMNLSEEDKTVVDALVSLGFKAVDVKNILAKIPKNKSIEERIQTALKLIK